MQGFPAFAGGVGSWFCAWGMQQVLFSWILVGELEASAESVGVAQTSTMLPALLLLMVGGAAADRTDPRRLLIRLHALAALPVLALAGASASGWIGLPALIAYGLVIGTIQAFAMPARDTLLSRVAGDSMMRAVTTMTAVQFGAQAAGTLAAGAARWTGSVTMLVVQAAVLLAGSIVTLGVPASDSPPAAVRGRSTWHEIADGLAQVRRTPRLRVPAILVIAVGILFVGPFMVVFPLLVREYYQGGVDMLSLILMLFPLGTISGSLVIRVRGIRRKGRAALIALTVGAGTQAAIGMGVPFPAMVVLTFVWGLGGSVFINCSRTLYQEAAPQAQRGRVLAVYQLGFMGGAPVGALLSGMASAAIGLHGTLLSASASMGLLIVTMAWLSDVRRMD